jgi:flavin reductase (DIM6/NTAB) family NADH-FMN oxidoreductase RutF
VSRLSETARQVLNLPCYGAVALQDPQSLVDVSLEQAGARLDVTHNNVVAALRPFTIGVMLDANDHRGWDHEPSRLCIHERGGSRRLLGVIYLRPVRVLPLPKHRFCLFETTGCQNHCVSTFGLYLHYLRERWRAAERHRRNPHNFEMTQADVRCSWAFYICPRPVVLVSVENQEGGNIFPMDLMGPTDSPWFSMALRRTSPAVALMQGSKRMALSSAPFAWKSIAYDLGKHHQKTTIEWDSLPFKTVRSPLFGLRVPEAAIRVREINVHEFHEVGSHMLFIASVLGDVPSPSWSNTNQLFHAFSSYRQYQLMNTV